MKGNMKIQKQKPVLAAGAFVLLVALIEVAGRRFGWPRNTRLLAILIILAIGILWLLFKSIRANQNAASLERSIKMQAEDQKQSLRPEKKGEIEELERELLAAIESLKSSKLGRGRSGRAALYSLPWYMFIGPPAAGKTTAIINSGLEFTFGSDIKGVGGTRNCDWFFSNSAILLDTAGRYITEDEDREEWLAFLDILKKHRKRSPINGVIIGISIADLLKASPDDLEWHARNVRRRIDELIQRLRVRFPVYLVITKLDLIQGFVEIFENLSRTEREQIWGCTLSPEEVRSPRPREVFEQEFDLLVKTLDDFRLKRLSLASKPESRGRVYVFPLEFAGVKDLVGHFIGKLFQPSPYQDVPIFRGFYFTSGTQEGVPIDRVIQAIAKQFDLPSEMVSEPEVQKKSYFIKKLFSDIIIPDRNLVSQTSRAATQRSRVRASVIFGSLICLGAFIFGISQGYIRSENKLRSVRDISLLVKDVNWESGASDAENLKLLESFRAKLADLEQKETHPTLGMSRANMVLEAARQLYYRKLSPFIQYRFYQELEGRLKRYRAGENYPYDTVWNYLKAYLLMGAESENLDETNTNFLGQELISLLDERMATEDIEETKMLVKPQIEYFIKVLGKEGMPSFANKDDLVQSTRRLLSRPVNLNDAYDKFKRDAQNKLQQTYTLFQMFEGRTSDLISSEAQVHELFTKGVWENYVKEAIATWSQNPDRDTWVLGQAQILDSDLRNPETLASGLADLYFQEYSRVWLQFLQGIRYAPFDDLYSASEALKKLSNIEESPLKRILDAVAQQTRFETKQTSKGLPKMVEGVKKALEPSRTSEASSIEDSAHWVNENFARLHTLSPAPGGGKEGSKEMADLLGQYASLNENLQYILSSPGLRAKEVAASILEREEGELPKVFKAIQSAFPESDFDPAAREALFEQPLRNVWGVILEEARKGLDDRWLNSVYDIYAKMLAPYYPFNPQGQDAPMPEVLQFFQPREGIVAKFIDQEIKPFVKLDTWESMEWKDRGLSISDEAVAAIDKAKEISQALFALGSLKVNFSLQADLPEPVGAKSEMERKAIKATIDRITIDIDGTPYLYRMGGESWGNFSWPGTEGTSGARLTLFSGKYSIPDLKAEGAWGWFRLLDKAEIVEIPPTEYQISWMFELPDRNIIKIRYRMKTKSSFHPFRGNKNFFRLDFPKTLTVGGVADST
jgi:type VI secretion system protein ImpL